MKLASLLENILDEDPVKVLDEYKDVIIDAWGKSLGDPEEHFSDYYYYVSKLHNEGGNVYRVLFLDSPKEINLKALGTHWTVSEYAAQDIVDENWGFYGKGKKKAFMVKATTPGNNISVAGVDAAGNPNEMEVNIKDQSKLAIVGVFVNHLKDFVPVKEKRGLGGNAEGEAVQNS